MMTSKRMRLAAWPLALAAALGAAPAHADIYTWVDSSGKVNVSNLQPPEGARVTGVFREDPAVRARAEAARAAAERDEVRALTDRVTQLEQDIEATKRAAPPPIVYAQPAPVFAYPEPAYPAVIAQTIIEPTQNPYGDCIDAWANCMWPGYFGFYPSSVVVVDGAHSRRFNALHPVHRHFGPPHVSALPGPVGLLPPPPNLFPGVANAFHPGMRTH